MSFARDLKQHLKEKAGSAPTDENPLRVIGFSPLILELGLSSDVLYKFCRNMARDLLVHHHEDRRHHDPIAAEYSRRFSRAFQILKSRKAFAKALQEFATTRSEERSEITGLKRALRDKAEILNRAMDELAELRQATEGGPAVHLSQQLRRRVQAIGTTVTTGGRTHTGLTTLDQTCKVHVLTFRVASSRTTPIDKPALSRLRSEYKRLLALKRDTVISTRIEGLRVQARSLGLAASAVNPLFKKAMNSSCAIPSIVWNETVAFQSRGFPALIEREKRRKVASSLTPELLEDPRAYKWALQSLQTTLSRTPIVSLLEVWGETITVASGKIVSNGINNTPTEWIIGSITPQIVERIGLFEPPFVKFMPETVLFQAHPLVIRGSFLVTKDEQSVRYRNANFADELAANFFYNIEKNPPVFRTERIVIGIS